MKSGTTAIADILALLPEVSFSSPKEPSLLMGRGYLHRNPGFIEPSLEERDAVYAQCFADALPGTLWGEGSVVYLSDPESPAIVTSRNSDVKMIFVLRDPAKRARSAFLYARSKFDEPADSMELAFEEELLGKRDKFLPTLRHLEYSSYVQHLERWQKVLKPGHLLLIEFEAYAKSPLTEIQRICAFLDINPPKSLPTKERSNVTVHSETKLARMVMRFLYQPSGLKMALKRILPGRLRSKLKVGLQDQLAARQGKPEPVSERCSQIMETRFSGMKDELEVKFAFRPQHWTSG